jgi:Mn2+/Fe2+ NRAMP family transporter
VLMMLMASNPKVMGTFVTPVLLRWVGWLSTGVMGAAVIAMFVFI